MQTEQQKHQLEPGDLVYNTSEVTSPSEAAVYRGKSVPVDTKTPAEWVREKLGFIADDLQTQVLNTDTKRGILNCTRQWGKSTVTAAKAVHHAMTKAGSLTIVVSPTERQSGEFVRKAAGFLAALK